MRDVHFIVDLQFGSTGKGLFAGYLARQIKPDTIVTAWGPNAGHTFIDADGHKMVNISFPNGIVAPSVRRVLFGPGTVIDCERMEEEYKLYNSLLKHRQIIIHPHAVVVKPWHREREKQYAFAIGSTMKGVGEAMMTKIRRDASNYEPPCMAGMGGLAGSFLETFVVKPSEYNNAIDRSMLMLVEGAQGYSLSINHGFYPYTTSRDCTVPQLMVDCGLPWQGMHGVEVHGVARTYPIRVANRYLDCVDCGGRGFFGTAGENSEDCQNCGGKGLVQTGTSGPCYLDQMELHWKNDLGLEPELTTVTKLPRRIFTFSEQQVAEAIRMSGVDDVFLNFCNYPSVHVADLVDKIEKTGASVQWTGWGPKVTDIREG